MKKLSDVGTLHISREQSEEVSYRIRKLIIYILEQAIQWSIQGNTRPMNMAMVGHCSFFIRLSGIVLQNCELQQLDWPLLIKRLRLEVPAGWRFDEQDGSQDGQIIHMWLQQLKEETSKEKKVIKW